MAKASVGWRLGNRDNPRLWLSRSNGVGKGCNHQFVTEVTAVVVTPDGCADSLPHGR
jgi:hypothetical protein